MESQNGPGPRPIDPREAGESLATVAEQRRRLADRLVTPWWYHPALGVLQGGLVVCLAWSSRSVWVLLVGAVAYGLGLTLLVRSYQRMTGLWVSGYRPGTPGRIALAMGAVFGVIALLVMLLTPVLDTMVLAWAGAALVLVVTVVLGHRFDRALRAELRGES